MSSDENSLQEQPNSLGSLSRANFVVPSQQALDQWLACRSYFNVALADFVRQHRQNLRPSSIREVPRTMSSATTASPIAIPRAPKRKPKPSSPSVANSKKSNPREDEADKMSVGSRNKVTTRDEGGADLVDTDDERSTTSSKHGIKYDRPLKYWPDGDVAYSVHGDDVPRGKPYFGWAFCQYTSYKDKKSATRCHFYYCLGVLVCPVEDCPFVDSPAHPRSKHLGAAPPPSKAKCSRHGLDLVWQSCTGGKLVSWKNKEIHLVLLRLLTQT